MLYFEYFQNYLLKELIICEKQYLEFKKYIKENNIIFSDELLLLVEKKIELCKNDIDSFRLENGFKNEILFRTLLQEISLIKTEFDWRSAAYQNSLHTNTYNLFNLDKKDVNYNRYGSKYILKIEEYLLELYNIPSHYRCLVTSSWMSAYSLIEWVLLRKLYHSNDTIYIPWYIYFESYEQISKLKSLWLKIMTWDSNSFNEEWILNYIYTNQPKFVFLDSVLNTSDSKVIDLDYIFSRLNNNYKKEIFIVTDLTMSWIDCTFTKYNNLNILMYGSASKYLFNWLDISMMWFVFVNKNFYEYAERQRRNIWAILYDFQACCYPRIWTTFFNDRLEAINQDVILFFNSLRNNNKINDKYKICYAWEKLFKIWKSFWWSIITISFIDDNLKNKENYSNLIDLLIKEAQKMETPLIEWVSFWFSITRISASDVMSKWEPPFLRVSIWPRYYNKIESIIEIFTKILINY